MGAAEELVEVVVRHGCKDAEVPLWVHPSATMLQVKIALVEKLGKGQPEQLRLGHVSGDKFAAYKDTRRLQGLRKVFVMGLRSATAAASSSDGRSQRGSSGTARGASQAVGVVC